MFPINVKEKRDRDKTEKAMIIQGLFLVVIDSDKNNGDIGFGGSIIFNKYFFIYFITLYPEGGYLSIIH